MHSHEIVIKDLTKEQLDVLKIEAELLSKKHLAALEEQIQRQKQA